MSKLIRLINANAAKVERVIGVLFFAGLFVVAALIITARLLGYL